MSGYLRDTLQAKIDKIILHPKECKRQVMYDRSNWSFAKRNRKDLSGKKILLLVDNMCGSDCEFITYVLGSLPRTVIAGQNTFGVLQYIQPGYGVLPNTGVPFRIARGSSDIYGDDRSVDGHGLDVDILLVEKDQQSSPAIIELAKFLSKK